MRGARLGLLLTALVLSIAAPPAHATLVAAKHVQVELVADTTAVVPGGDFTLGVHFIPDHEWHVYWRNPGDSGEAPRVDWTVPDGVTVGALQWPAPTRLETAGLVNFGYPGETMLIAPATAAADVARRDALTVAAHVRWLVCNRDECIPGTAQLATSVPIGGAPASANATLFDVVRRQMPAAPPATWQLTAAAADDRVRLSLTGTPVAAEARPFFFSDDRQSFEPARQTWTRDATGGTFTLARRSATDPPARLAGVLDLGGRTYAVDVPIGAAAATTTGPKTKVGALEPRLTPLVLAFLGGLLLNLMPCVFPVLALKALALATLGGEARRRIRRHGLDYTLGILVSFWVLAGLLLAARAAGAELGWGFQLQNPTVIAALAALFFWMALLLLDVTAIGGSLMGFGQHLTVGEGDRAAFFTGMLATVVATPCTAPFMGTALGYALGQPATTALAVFTALGLGLAFPYVAITFVPHVAQRLPRPGKWMETLKQLLAFPLLVTVVWLVWVASFQAGPQAVAAILMMLVLLTFAAWARGRWSGGVARAVATAAVAVAALLAVTIRPVDEPPTATAATAARARGDAAATTGLQWEPFSAARVAELRAQGRPVFVDFTAAWCVTCQVNKKVALETAAVIEKMRQLGVVAVRADWTRPDPEITRALQEFGRDGVPLYVLYSGRRDDPPRILPQILTPTIVISELEQIGRRET
jgi:thiol:disulfide interchange protein DsbD